MTSRFSEPADPFEEQGLASPNPDIVDELLSGDDQDEIAVPGDAPIEAEDWGMTAEEELAGEPLDGRLARELPDVSDGNSSGDPYPEDADEQVGRLVSPDEGARDDVDKDEVATSVGTDLGGFSAEERAMHIDPNS